MQQIENNLTEVGESNPLTEKTIYRYVRNDQQWVATQHHRIGRTARPTMTNHDHGLATYFQADLQTWMSTLLQRYVTNEDENEGLRRYKRLHR